MSSLLKPARPLLKSNEARITELEQRCRFLEHNVAKLAQALSSDLQTMLAEIGKLKDWQTATLAAEDKASAMSDGVNEMPTTHASGPGDFARVRVGETEAAAQFEAEQTEHGKR